MKLYRDQKEKQVSGLKKVYEFIKNNKIKIAIVSGVLIITTLIFANIINKPTKAELLNNSVAIVQTHDNHSEASEIKNYLKISEELNDFMNIHRIMGIEEEITEKAEKTTLMSVKNLEKEIKDTNELFGKSDIQQEDLISRIKNLMVQERLVNKYLYNSYYKVNSILEEALRTYAGEKYGIIDTQNINFYAQIPERDGIVDYTIYYGTFENSIDSGIDGDLKAGMYALQRLTTSKDPNSNDNDKYNEDRNKILKNGLIQSGNLYNIVDKENLFSEKHAKKFRK